MALFISPFGVWSLHLDFEGRYEQIRHNITWQRRHRDHRASTILGPSHLIIIPASWDSLRRHATASVSYQLWTRVGAKTKHLAKQAQRAQPAQPFSHVSARPWAKLLVKLHAAWGDWQMVWSSTGLLRHPAKLRFWSVSFNFVRRTSWACGRTCQTLTSSCWIRDESLPVSTLSIGKRLGRGSFPSWRLPQHIALKWEHAIVSAGPTFQTRSCVWHLKHLGHPRSSNWWLVVPEKLK